MTETATQGLMLTQAAITKISQLLANEEQELFLRVAVQPGGCAGLRYELYFDDQHFDGDMEMSFGEDVMVVVDEKSAPYLSGATIDFADTISKQGFVIDNPNAQGSCACGDSFN
ncbi:MAG: iron-sulfur cluster assembly accessory protein [Propionibacteriaceae bacterium]|jgi:iron-sulfur cluster assembly accessory protein|nr:iron-sulfur cluster assembly accessory protein [Propionibacteriaceae bacterium]